MKIIFFSKSLLEIEPPPNRNHLINIFRFKEEEHLGVKTEPTF